MKSIILLCVLWPALALAQASTPLRRFALLAGANNGGPDRVQLRYAVSDAQALSDVLGQLGGVAPEDRLLVAEPNPAALEGAFKEMGRRLSAARAAGDRVELLFYYSGHSDEQGLLLGGERVGYTDLRRRVDGLPADVRIAIVDACASGALTRTKGGRRRPPFLVDSAVKVQGYAILTSASADESAQESDRVGGSFFTHALLSGLRGAADTTADGRVTLNEAYQFAYHETLARTEQTRLGAQHPSYDLNLSGQGDVVLTDVRSTGAGLVIDEAIAGRLYVRDPAGQLVAELNKPAGRSIELGFAPGTYRITLDHNGALSRTEIALADGQRTALASAAFQPVDGEVAVARGGVEAPVVAANIGILPGLDTNSGRAVTNRVSLNLLVGQGWRLDGLEVGGLGNLREGGVRGAQVAGLFNVNEAELNGLQVAGLFNLVDGSARGAVAGGLFNTVGGSAHGLVVGGLFSTVGDGLNGLQVGGLFNQAGGEGQGLQVGGLVNVTGALRGAQIGGIANVAERIQGLQVGLVNVADDAEGTQIGLVNIATHMRGAPIGLINIIGDGIHEVEVGASDVAPARLAVHLGSQSFYTSILAGARFTEDVYLLGAGLGGRIHLNPTWTIDIGATTQGFYDTAASFSDDHLDMLNRLEVTAGWRLAPNLALTFGPALNVLVSKDRDGEDLAFGLGRLYRDGDLNVRLWPGVSAGVTLF